jgi:beta-galactosidase
VFDTTGRLDLVRFLQIVHEEGLRAIVRPGPFVCAEWDNGGLPGWLTADPAVGLRRAEPRYLAAVGEYLRTVYQLIGPLQVDRGGPVVLVQVENEYGAYGADRDYLRELVRLTRECGITVPLTSIDQPEPQMLEHGSVEGLHRTASFGTRAAERLTVLRRHQPTGPLMCAEFWCGWFDHWGGHHHTSDPDQVAAELDTLLAAGASVNIYMLHGGTSFGLTSGANDKGVYQPTVTSYDYDAPLDEAGSPTAGYWQLREVISRYADVPADAPVAAGPAPTHQVPLVAVEPLATAAQAVGGWTTGEPDRDAPPTLDELAHWRGLAYLRATVPIADRPRVLSVHEVRDRVQVFLDGRPVGVLARDHHDRRLVLPPGGGELLLLVEDQGRVNYGPRLGEAKGVIGPVRLDGRPVRGWSALPVELDAIAARVRDLPAVSAPVADQLAGPVLARARFELTEPADLFLATDDWGKGMAWVNGWPLGRYWSRGPQHTLYVPGPATVAGANDLVVLELTAARATARLVAGPDLGHTEV